MLAHEHYHVIQYDICRRADLCASPEWLIEGTATYGEYLYREARDRFDASSAWMFASLNELATFEDVATPFGIVDYELAASAIRIAVPEGVPFVLHIHAVDNFYSKPIGWYGESGFTTDPGEATWFEIEKSDIGGIEVRLLADPASMPQNDRPPRGFRDMQPAARAPRLAPAGAQPPLRWWTLSRVATAGSAIVSTTS